MAHIVFVPGTVIPSSWLNDVDTLTYGGPYPTSATLAGTGGAGLVGFLPTGTGAVATTVQAALDKFNQLTTGNFFSNSGGKVNRINDRLLIGSATLNDGSSTASQPSEWLTTYQLGTGRTNGFIEFAQTAILTNTNANATNGLVVGARTSTLAGAGNSVPITAVGLNNQTGFATNAYGFYGEAYNILNSLGAAYGMELDTVNYRGVSDITPYAQSTTEVIALQLAAGAELSSVGQFASSAAINIWNNNSTFERGIVFGSSAISGATGTSGTGIAIAMGQGHILQWYGSNVASTSSIFCTVTAANAANATGIQFTNNGMQVQMPGGQVVGAFSANATAANWLQFVSGNAGNPVQLQAQGSDTNINLLLQPKGTGVVQFGTFAASVLSVTGYITILDQGGTPRRLLIG